MRKNQSVEVLKIISAPLDGKALVGPSSGDVGNSLHQHVGSAG